MNITSLKTYGFILLALIGCVALIGCAVQRKNHHSSSAFQYLYPDKEGYVDTPGIPLLSLPLRVGIAFVPETADSYNALTEQNKMDLMNEVSMHFKKYDFVKSIELIPSAYLTEKGSFPNLDQISTMYGIDVVALLSYDQTQFTDQGMASITYWTIVGAYIVPGEKNATHTMVDASIYDIRSRKMLFRAPGINYKKSNATPVNLTEQLRTDSVSGFQEASNDLITNLDIQLGLLKEKIKESPEDYKIEHKPGYTGGGSLDVYSLIFIFILGGYWLWRKRKRKA